MGAIRREQICRAAAAVIAREGFAGSTMRLVADEAGVSTGMLNHYFSNRQELLTQAFVYVAERSHRRYAQSIAGTAPGTGRLEALLESVLGDDVQSLETWQMWIGAQSEAMRVPELRGTIEQRLSHWFELLGSALEGLVPPERPGEVPWTWRVDALLTGLAIQSLTSEADLPASWIRDEVLRLVAGMGGHVPAPRAHAAAR
jgi:AcrR family transcriptional regulator